MGKWEKTFKVLESEAQQTLIMLYEGISRSKGGVVKMTKRTVPFTEPPPEEMSLNRGVRHDCFVTKVEATWDTTMDLGRSQTVLTAQTCAKLK